MFVRYRKVKNGSTRVQIVENYRIGNKIVQKVLRHAGTAKNDAELPMLVNLHHLREDKRIITGFHEVYGKLFDRIG